MSIERSLLLLIDMYEAEAKEISRMLGTINPKIDYKSVITTLRSIIAAGGNTEPVEPTHLEEVMGPSPKYNYHEGYGPRPTKIYLAYEESPNIFKYKLEQSTTSK